MRNELVVFNKPKSNISEDIRTLRTNLQFKAIEKTNKTLLITSSIPKEGKSFISSNLACAFAQNGNSVLLIDCDLRLGRLHRIFNLDNKFGLSNLLINKNIKEYKDYTKPTKLDSLYVITRGTTAPNTSELLNSKYMKELITTVSKHFDYIIFDGSPVNGLPDSLVMAGLVDQVALVARANYTKIDDLNQAKKALEKVGANIAGVILNKTENIKKTKYYNFYE